MGLTDNCLFDWAKLTAALRMRLYACVRACLWVGVYARTNRLYLCRSKDGLERLSSISRFVLSCRYNKKKKRSRVAKLSDLRHGHKSAEEPVCGLWRERRFHTVALRLFRTGKIMQRVFIVCLCLSLKPIARHLTQLFLPSSWRRSSPKGCAPPSASCWRWWRTGWGAQTRGTAPPTLAGQVMKPSGAKTRDTGGGGGRYRHCRHWTWAVWRRP